MTAGLPVDLSNPYVRKLKKCIKTFLNNPPRDFFKDILESYDKILIEGKIDILSVVKGREYHGKNFSAEKRIEKMKSKDGRRLIATDDELLLVSEITLEIIDILKNYKMSLSLPNNREDNTRKYSYRNAIEDPSDDDSIIPDENTDLASIKLNLFYNKDVKFIFNDNIPLEPLDTSSSTLQHLKIKINGILEHNIIPIKRKVICTEKVDGVECGNVVHFSDIHMNSKIRCTDSKDRGSGHVIKKLEKAIVEESKTLYVYEGVDVLSSTSSTSSTTLSSGEMIICSLIELNSHFSSVNAVFVNDESSHYILVLSAKEEKIKPLKSAIFNNRLSADDNNNHHSYFLDNIYKSLQDYLNEYHNIVLTNQNRIIGHIIIFIILNNIFYKKRMNSLIVGKSGSGKSVWSELLIPLFTLNHKTILGTDVTRNKFIGGRSNIISSTMNSLFSAGYIATQDIIFAEECTNSLKDFQDTKLNQSNNIFHLIKSCSGRDIDVAIQGGQKIYPKASTILVGNLEQLEFTQEYKKLVASKYRKLKEGEDRDFKEKWPLFKPISYYIDVLKNVKLAEAHAIVRQNYRGIAGFQYILRLPPAEMARYSFFVTLEDDLDNNRDKRVMKKEEMLMNPKRNFIIEELSEIFLDSKTGLPIICPYSLKKQINDFYNDEFYNSRHNYKNIFGSADGGVNTHIENNMITIMEQLVWMNKLYNHNNTSISLPDPTLTDDDKKLIYYFLSFNYNTLSKKEASMVSKPRINDFEGLYSESLNVDLKSVEDYVKKKEDERQREMDEMLPFLDDNESQESLL